MTDNYAPAAGAYDLVSAGYRPATESALRTILPRLRPDAGPVVDVGAGSGANLAFLLDAVPDIRVLAIEPSASMRALCLSRIAAHPQWYDRVTIRPETFDDAPLPESIAGAILIGVLGHFDPIARAAVVAELADRLPPGGVALVDLQAPSEPTPIAAFEFATATIGDLEYRGIAEATPLGDDERMRWRMTYLTLEGERVLAEDTVEHIYHHPRPKTLGREATAVGLELSRIDDGQFWLLTRP